MSKDNWTGNWPIERALSMQDWYLKEFVREEFRTGDIGNPYYRDVAGDTPEAKMAYEIGLRNGLHLGSMHIRNINEIQPPDPPTFYNDVARMTRKVRGNLAQMIQEIKYAAEDILTNIQDFVESPNRYEDDE